MSEIKNRADDVLVSLRKRRPTPACYPCGKRKVRCRGGRPCDTCVARGHPDICHDETAGSSRRSKPQHIVGVHAEDRLSSSVRPGGPPAHLPAVTSTTPETGATTPAIKSHIVPACPPTGRFSAMNFIRDRLAQDHDMSSEQIHPTIGLGNNSEPQMQSLGLIGSADKLHGPQREEVLLYYPPFRDSIIPLYPVVYDVTELERIMYESLRDSPNLEYEQIAVVLASLALGAQFAIMVRKPRRELSQELISRSNAYLQRANYLFRPTIGAVQALLLIGMALQNSGQSEAAWTLLGLTYRLGQTLGLHLVDPDHGPEGTLWASIIWQDSFLSMRYDRSPLSHGACILELREMSNLSYSQAVRGLCAMCVAMLRQPQSMRQDAQSIRTRIQNIDSMLSRCCEHLQPGADLRTFEQRIQHFALKLHSSVMLAELCRPMFSIPADESEGAANEIRSRGLLALTTVIEAFIELCSFNGIPLRLWSMTQAATSCAVVLALLDCQRITTSKSALLRRLVDTLKRNMGVHDPTTEFSPSQLQGLCLMRIKAAGLLESLLESVSQNLSPEGHQDADHTQAISGTRTQITHKR